MKTIFVFCCLVYISYGCKMAGRPKCTITIDELLHKKGARVFGTDVVNGKIIEFRDKGKDSIMAGYYTFYPSGHLKSYHFFIDMMNYIYSEEYDSLGNRIITQGEPLLHRIVERVNEDSLVVRTYFFSMHKSYKALQIRTMKNDIFSINLKDDSLFSYSKCFVRDQLQKSS